VQWLGTEKQVLQTWKRKCFVNELEPCECVSGQRSARTMASARPDPTLGPDSTDNDGNKLYIGHFDLY
jgi:hypothetical protein